ncbi:MAG: DUF3971 domain-containing protein [Desulfobacterales bacterium]|nr:DUF3971 domain-containing protein [Desulfobacterales bacterium]
MIALALIVPYLIEPALNSPQVKSRLIKEIQAYTDVKLEPEDIEFFLAPVPGVRFFNVDLKFSEQFHLEIDSTEVELDIIKLLDRKIAISQINFQAPHLEYTPSTEFSKKELQEEQSFDFKLPSRNVDRLFALFPDSQDDLEINVTQAKTNYFSNMDGRFRVFKDNRSMDFNAAIQGIEICQGQFPELDRLIENRVKCIKIDSLLLDVSLDRTNTLSGRIVLDAFQGDMTQLPKAPLSAKQLDVGFSLSKDRIYGELRPASFTYPKANIGVEFSHVPGDQKAEIIFSGENVDIGQARQVCLPLLKGVDVSDTLFDILRSGTAQVITVGFKGKSLEDLFDGENLYLDGNAVSASVKIPEVPIIAEDVFGKATMEKGILHIEPQKGRVGKTKITGGVLDLDLIHYDDVPFSGKFPLKSDLQELPQTLISLLPGTQLAEELEQIQKISGRADALLELNLQTGQSDLDVKVNAFDIQATAEYQRLPLPIKIDDGEFLLDGNTIILSNLSGLIGTSPVSDLYANIDITDEPNLELGTFSACVELDEISPVLRSLPKIMESIDPADNFSGTLNFEQIQIQGPMFNLEKWNLHFLGSTNDVSIFFSSDKPGITDLACKFYGSDSMLGINDLSASVKNIDWLGKEINSDYTSSIIMPLDILEGTIRKQTGKDLFKGKLVAPSGPLLSFELTGDSIDSMTPTLITIKDPAISDVKIIPNPEPDKPRISFEGRLNTLTLEKMLKQGSPLYKKLVALTAGTPVTVFTDNDSRIHLDTEQLNLDAILSKEEKKDRKKKSSVGNRPFFKQKELLLTAEELTYREQVFKGVKAKIAFNKERTRIDVKNANLCGLDTPGYVNILHHNSKPVVSTKFNITSTADKDISAAFGCLFRTHGIIEGSYSFKGELSGSDTPDLIESKLSGNISFQAESGRIYKATLLSRVLSVLNILGDTDLRQDGFGYKTMTVKADVKDSVIHLEKAYIDADNMAIIASGWVDPLNDKLDVTFLVAPFKTIDTIIQHIPIVNTILSGRLVSFPAKASGKISDPTVIPLHPSAVGTGLINLFGDLIKAPVRLFEGESTND